MLVQKRVSKLLCLALSVWHEGVELFKFIRGDVLHHSMQKTSSALSGVEVLLLSLSRVFVTQDCRYHGLKPNLPFTRVDCMAYWPHTGASTSCFVKMKGEIGYYGTTFCLHIKDSNYPKMKAFFSCWDTNITWLQIGLLKSTITLIFLTLRQQK